MLVAVVYSFYILAAGITNTLFAGLDQTAIFGLGTGFLVSCGNYRLLNLAIRKFSGKKHLLTVQVLFLRYILYAAMAYICLYNGNNALIMYTVAVTGLPLAIFIVYGIGGTRINDTY